MVFPLYDENPSRSFPLVTILLIIANVLVFVYESLLPRQMLQEFISRLAFTPAIFSRTGDFTTIFTAMFMHGGFVHIAGNMLYLWIFGNNIEDALGHVKFLLFYLAAGVAGTLVHYFFDPAATIPSLGASGAIAGVLGGYLVLYPRASIVSWVPIFFLYRLPALIVIGLWFIVQFANGYFALAANITDGGGVAWFAHIGGFIAGLIMVLLLPKRQSNKWLRS